MRARAPRLPNSTANGSFATAAWSAMRTVVPECSALSKKNLCIACEKVAFRGPSCRVVGPLLPVASCNRFELATGWKLQPVGTRSPKGVDFVRTMNKTPPLPSPLHCGGAARDQRHFLDVPPQPQPQKPPVEAAKQLQVQSGRRGSARENSRREKQKRKTTAAPRLPPRTKTSPGFQPAPGPRPSRPFLQ